jgi:hypothetical protein
MSGDIWLSKDVRWLANSSLYHWVLNFLIVSIDKPDTVRDLEEIRDNNLGLINIEDFDLGTQRQMVYLLRESLVPEAESRLRGDMEGRQDLLEALQELADMAKSRAI